MKSLLLTLLVPLLIIVVRRNTFFFDGLYFMKSDCDIAWNDIAKDLWP